MLMSLALSWVGLGCGFVGFGFCLLVRLCGVVGIVILLVFCGGFGCWFGFVLDWF